MKQYLFLLLILTSCTKDSKFEENIIQTEKKWQYFSSDIKIDSLKKYKFIYYIRFDKNGKWGNYFISDNSISWGANYRDWFYNSKDSTLIMGEENEKEKELKFKILRYTEDTIYLENNKKEREFLINLKKVN